jgi:hypothetical protein
MVQTYGTGGTTTVTQEITGGNPDFYRRITNTVAAPGTGTSIIFVFHKYLSGTYDPGIQGAIASIDYSEDSIMFSGFGEGQASSPALIQAGVVYYYPLYLLTNQSNWTTQTISGLTAADFSSVPWIAPLTHPDFSVAGDPIVFGFQRSNSTSHGYTIVGGIDNWTLRAYPKNP